MSDISFVLSREKDCLFPYLRNRYSYTLNLNDAMKFGSHHDVFLFLQGWNVNERASGGALNGGERLKIVAVRETITWELF